MRCFRICELAETSGAAARGRVLRVAFATVPRVKLEALDESIVHLRQQVRRAAAAGERARVRRLRAELRAAERAWEEALDPGLDLGEPDVPPVREAVHRALTLLGVPAAARLIVAVDEAFHGGSLRGERLIGLLGDEERAFRAAPDARPYRLCAALTADLLSPARGLIAVSTWPMEARVVGPLSARTGFLTAAIRVAERIIRLRGTGRDAAPAAYRLLTRMARNIPGAVEGYGPADPATVAAAARAELAVHEPADRALRSAAAARAMRRLGPAERLFGAGLRAAGPGRASRVSGASRTGASRTRRTA
jgi:hypothetical protein